MGRPNLCDAEWLPRSRLAVSTIQ